MVDQVFLLVAGDSVLGVHQHGFEGVNSLETNLYWRVLEDLLVRFTQPWEIRN